jgi:Ca2+-binding RTX toxin-like protein
MRRVVLTAICGSMMVFLVTGVAFAGSFYGTSGNEFLYGTSESDFLSAGPGDDELYGYEGDDIIYTADGTYPGYGSTDTIYCGEGNDFVVIDANDLVSSDCEVYEFDLAVYPAA